MRGTSIPSDERENERAKESKRGLGKVSAGAAGESVVE